MARTRDAGYTVEEGTGCWIWLGAKGKNGYGRIEIDGKSTGAHRWYWERIHGPMPEGMEPHHKCENPACVNPAHIEPVTHGENLRAGIQAKLDWQKVREIRASSETPKVLADRYGVSVTLIYEVKRNACWVEDGLPLAKTRQVNVRMAPDFHDELTVEAKRRGVSFAKAVKEGARLWLDQAPEKAVGTPAVPREDRLEVARPVLERITAPARGCERCGKGVTSPTLRRCTVCNGKIVPEPSSVLS